MLAIPANFDGSLTMQPSISQDPSPFKAAECSHVDCVLRCLVARSAETTAAASKNSLVRAADATAAPTGYRELRSVRRTDVVIPRVADTVNLLAISAVPGKIRLLFQMWKVQ